ncbi:MAG: hypothetical protein K0R10_157 [Alphaproteobacteria bacterium]|nr:hypothetical protein [Alphaproteobacteria bacterium]
MKHCALKIILTAAIALLIAAPASAQVQYFSAGKKAPVEGQWQGEAPAPTEEQPAAANELAPAPQTRIVTSLQKCLDQLEPEEQAIVRANYNKPYQTCNSMVAAKAGKKKKAAAKKKRDEEEPEAESARNFVRVQDERTAGTEPEVAADDFADEPESAPRKKRKKKSWFDWDPTIKADKSKAKYNR